MTLLAPLDDLMNKVTLFRQCPKLCIHGTENLHIGSPIENVREG